MEAYDMFLNGQFVALPAFQRRYGVLLANGEWSITTAWQSGLNQAGQCGAFIGVFIAGPLANRIGYRLTALAGLVLMAATIFVSFFANSLWLLMVG
jgi:SP family general alpha glucoside:H+ symporter-like MFS transporter